MLDQIPLTLMKTVPSWPSERRRSVVLMLATDLAAGTGWLKIVEIGESPASFTALKRHAWGCSCCHDPGLLAHTVYKEVISILRQQVRVAQEIVFIGPDTARADVLRIVKDNPLLASRVMLQAVAS